VRGEAVRLGRKTTSYRRWGEELERRAGGEEVRGELGYWREELGGERRELPVDEESGENEEGSGEVAAREGGRGGAGEEEKGREEEVVGGGLDRSRRGGWFTAMWPLRLEVGEEGGGEGEELKRVKEKVRGVPRRGLGYGLLRWLCPEREVREEMARLGGGEL